ncbi:MAG TPA: hypothetical protein VK427_18015, partial [Kofleriaceae bacterium]|nr:hypothetical protein [Kofleriaceae bacterium]
MIDALFANVPDPAPIAMPGLDIAVADSVAYLGTDAAIGSLATDVYWPKWHSPWWHMLVLWELGEAARIPRAAVRAMVEGLDGLRLKILPTDPSEVPQDFDSRRDI